MAVYVVTWNLNKEGAAYQQARTAFLNHLAKYDNTRDSQLETVRWISTNDSAQQVSDYLRQKLDSNDRFFCVKGPFRRKFWLVGQGGLGLDQPAAVRLPALTGYIRAL